jgi:uncharacterized membrane protein YhaH (DUF805 family)
VPRKAATVKRLWRDYNLSVVLGLLFVVTWIGQLITEWFTFASEQQEHNQPLQIGQFLWEFWQSTLENWQSEFLQLFSFVVLATLFIHKGSAESKDSDEQMQKSLDRIEKRLKALEGQEKSGAKSS